MKLTNARSAPVLDRASSFEKKLNWELFCMEQETLLHSDPGTWLPGDPIRDHPWTHGRIYSEPTEFDSWPGPSGNHVRPMIELLGDRARKMSCQTCEVSGRSSDSVCWNCGESIRPSVSEHSFGNYTLEFNVSLDVDFPGWAALWGSMNQQFLWLRDEAQRFTVSMTGLFDLPPPNPPIRSRSIFEVRDQPIELVRPVAADLSRLVEGSVHIPEDVDLSGRMIPELPSLDLPEVSIVDHGYRIPPASEIRRRREL